MTIPPPPKSYLIYSILLPNSKRYIGMTTSDIRQVIFSHKHFSTDPKKAKQKLYMAIQQAGGWDAALCEVLAENIPTKSEAKRIKDQLILKHDTIANGLNEHRGINVVEEARLAKPPKLYRFRDPFGLLVETSSIAVLCREHNRKKSNGYFLNSGAMSRIWSGKLEQHNGWRKWHDEPKEEVSS